ncbi:hypothetical protein MRX96_018339 [Rhipicephalus microplus]
MWEKNEWTTSESESEQASPVYATAPATGTAHQQVATGFAFLSATCLAGRGMSRRRRQKYKKMSEARNKRERTKIDSARLCSRKNAALQDTHASFPDSETTTT